jgi:hypothetical protein
LTKIISRNFNNKSFMFFFHYKKHEKNYEVENFSTKICLARWKFSSQTKFCSKFLNQQESHQTEKCWRLRKYRKFFFKSCANYYFWMRWILKFSWYCSTLIIKFLS